MQSPNQYQGKQVIITSDRLLFNSREDLLHTSNGHIIFSTNEDFHFNTDNVSSGKFAVNSPKIHLGVIKDSSPELANNPAVKGKELEDLLEALLNHLNILYTTVLPLLTGITTLPTLPTIPSPTNASLISPLVSELNTLKARIKKIKSDNVYIK
jgi:hypothetical protein